MSSCAHVLERQHGFLHSPFLSVTGTMVLIQKHEIFIFLNKIDVCALIEKSYLDIKLQCKNVMPKWTFGIIFLYCSLVPKPNFL